MAPLRRTHLFYLLKIKQAEQKLPQYHRPVQDLAKKGYVRISDPDELGDCLVSITSKGVRAVEGMNSLPDHL
ncbi:hypothetical protein ABFT80_14730 [Mesorhizobium sp. SB112]|uniref:hypothetical protein n=1 Tax=Mesorhizobium sp. SB112 TaxID=3151853 RepID=UPI003267D14E